VKPILDARCGTCHVEAGIAPMDLRSWATVSEYLELDTVLGWLDAGAPAGDPAQDGAPLPDGHTRLWSATSTTPTGRRT
jgi:hypothetical protein